MVGATMPSSTGRHTLRKNLREAKHYGDEDREGIDHFNENGLNTNNAKGGGGGVSEDKRASFADMHWDDEKEPIPRRLSSNLVNDLADPKSELAHFLLANNNDEDDVGLFDGFFHSPVFENPMMKSVRNLTTRFITGEDEVHDVQPLGSNKAWFYSLALEPMEVRRDRIIMLAEAYAIFGALFLSGTWVLYEWGSSYGYGGCMWEETSYCHPSIDRAFEAVMTLSITANLFQAMFASFLWLMSILFSGSHGNWVYASRKLLVLCHHLLTAVFVLTILGVGLGIYSKLAPNWPELVVALLFLLTTALYGIAGTANLVAEEASLEYYHFPLWFKWFIFPYPMLKRGGRQKIREAAEERAKKLKARAYQERAVLDPSAAKSKSRTVPKTSVGALLRRAANAIGRRDFDVSKYEERLEADWYNDSNELRSMSVEILSKYMPRRLAEEVHGQLALDPTSVKTFSIGTGVFPGERSSPERRASWNNLDERRASWDMDSD